MLDGRVGRATLLGGGTVTHRHGAEALTLALPRGTGIVPVVKIEGEGIA